MPIATQQSKKKLVLTFSSGIFKFNWLRTSNFVIYQNILTKVKKSLILHFVSKHLLAQTISFANSFYNCNDFSVFFVITSKIDIGQLNHLEMSSQKFRNKLQTAILVGTVCKSFFSLPTTIKIVIRIKNFCTKLFYPTHFINFLHIQCGVLCHRSYKSF